MPRLMSVAFTEQQVRDRAKTVTRRKGWWEDKNGRRMLKPGDRLTLCRKVMGRKPDEPLVRICDVEVVSIRREPLAALLPAPGTPAYIVSDYAHAEMAREGFPRLAPVEFVRRYFIVAQGMTEADVVTRIEWRYLDGRDPRVWNHGDEEPADHPQVRDCMGDVWTWAPGTFEWSSPETQNCAWTYMTRKWAPLTEVVPGGGAS